MSRLTKRQRLTSKQLQEVISPEQPWRYRTELNDEEYWGVLDTMPQFTVEDLTLQPLCYFPGERELPPEGAWIWVIRPPHTPIELQFGGWYFAKPYKDGNKTAHGWREMKYSVTVHAPEGEVRLWPYEYAKPPLEELIEGWSDGWYEFHMFDEDMQPEITERLFYVMSRGIPLQEALPMALGEVLAPVGWFEMKEENNAVSSNAI